MKFIVYTCQFNVFTLTQTKSIFTGDTISYTLALKQTLIFFFPELNKQTYSCLNVSVLHIIAAYKYVRGRRLSWHFKKLIYVPTAILYVEYSNRRKITKLIILKVFKETVSELFKVCNVFHTLYLVRNILGSVDRSTKGKYGTPYNYIT